MIGATQQIKWNHNLGLSSYVMIELSRDGGTNWEVISASFKNTGATASTFNWVVTGPATTQGRVRVSWLNGAVSDISDVNFNVVNPAITVTQPNTALVWAIGTSQQIKWSHNAGSTSTYTIALSRDGGVTFPEVLTTSAPATTATTGIYNWTVTGPASTTARVRVTLTANPASTDISNVNFTIANPSVTVTQPNMNLNWGIGSTQQIKWNHNVGLGATFIIEVSRDGGATYPELITNSAPATTATTGVYNWIVTGPTTSLTRIRITWTANSAVTDSSNVNFRIADPFITVTQPNTTVTWLIGSVQQIKWNHNLGTSAFVHIELSRDGGSTWADVTPSAKNSGGASSAYSWLVTGPATTMGRIRVFWTTNPPVTDISNVNFTVQ
jgi:hypothetical protein